MNLKLKLTLFCAFGLYLNAISQVTANDGNWNDYYVNMKHTPEADQMVRFGDVDNLGFGWDGLDPFKGDITPKHAFPWKRNVNDSIGLDMVMVISSNSLLKEVALNNCHGYSSERNTLLNEFGKTNFEVKFSLNLDKEIKIEKMMMQMFLTDVQAKRYNLQYRVYLNGRRAEFMEKTINNLDQTGEYGKLVSFYVPQDFFNEFTKKDFRLMMDDSISPNCEGFAIDFIKVLVNPVSTPPGELKVILKDQSSLNTIADGRINNVDLGQYYTTDSKGELILKTLPLGSYGFTATADGYNPAGFFVDIDAEEQEQIIYLTRNSNNVYSPSSQPGQPPVIVDEGTGVLKQLIKVVLNNPSSGSPTNTGGNNPKTDTRTNPVKKSTDGPGSTNPTNTKPPTSTRRR